MHLNKIKDSEHGSFMLKYFFNDCEAVVGGFPSQVHQFIISLQNLSHQIYFSVLLPAISSAALI